MEESIFAQDAVASKPRDKRAYRSSVLLQAHIFLGLTVALLSLYRWPLRWLLSGAPVLTYCLWLGEGTGYRVLPFAPLWTLILLVNSSYAVAATSWLLYGLFLPTCYTTVFISSLYQSNRVANLVRRILSGLLNQLHFINDKVAFFNIPALEIDTEVSGLMVIRGITFSLSHLTLVAHGVEVGIKLSEDLELALQVDEVNVRLFRGIDIGDVFGNLKGGEFEMTFGSLADATQVDGASIMMADTPLLQAAAKHGEFSQPKRVSTMDQMTDGSAPKSVSPDEGIDSMTQITPDAHKATSRYADALKYINETSVIRESEQKVQSNARLAPNADTRIFDPKDIKDMRAAICSELHDQPSVPHPPHRSIKVTTLQNMTPPNVRKFMHRLPFLLRLLLNPLAYFHTLHIKSITAGGSGKWLQHTLHEMIFKEHSANDTGIAKLEQRLSSWLADANFVLEIANIVGLAQVPLSTAFDVTTQMRFDDVMAYRTLPQKVDLKQVVRLGGADCSITVPSFLLPHHEHILPTFPTKAVQEEKEAQIAEADGKPKTIQAEQEFEQTQKDETNMNLSVHARLPAVFDQELLDFVAALVKATKIIEMQDVPDNVVAADSDAESINDADSISESLHDSSSKRSISSMNESTKRSIRAFAHAVGTDVRKMGTDVRKGVKRVAVDAVANDRWIAKLVGKVTKKLEVAQGDIGYSGGVPISLAPYRAAAEQATKLLP
ncbi:hypothetical protein EDD37DRAFT_342629 [Exophiala viscosa]|uniref:Uncharacterized protein n=1 Tax=Exophiala viscosa TaxID=2486360 RepID=A0AAN6DV19_9EURO|nr:hypothetical protein EDD36DRAFT_261022 [Exophiala viscosa]KAI1626379.1 hypothetical protein EDD37DRAFT_342629 [Exophiala viscosa]